MRIADTRQNRLRERAVGTLALIKIIDLWAGPPAHASGSDRDVQSVIALALGRTIEDYLYNQPVT